MTAGSSERDCSSSAAISAGQIKTINARAKQIRKKFRRYMDRFPQLGGERDRVKIRSQRIFRRLRSLSIDSINNKRQAKRIPTNRVGISVKNCDANCFGSHKTNVMKSLD